MNIRKLIEKQRAALAQPVVDVIDVSMGGETVPVTIARLSPDDWQELVDANPPRTNVAADRNVGFDQVGLTRNYPAVSIDGEPLRVEDWQELYDVLNSVNRNMLGVTIWNLNILMAITERDALIAKDAAKKAKKGQNNG